ncbi:MAG: hypothetical protein KA436_11455 [Oligoflexales bacterium]|nr:hypothetical protein [Oligoflexales bacterium]
MLRKFIFVCLLLPLCSILHINNAYGAQTPEHEHQATQTPPAAEQGTVLSNLALLTLPLGGIIINVAGVVSAANYLWKNGRGAFWDSGWEVLELVCHGTHVLGVIFPSLISPHKHSGGRNSSVAEIHPHLGSLPFLGLLAFNLWGIAAQTKVFKVRYNEEGQLRRVFQALSIWDIFSHIINLYILFNTQTSEVQASEVQANNEQQSDL